LIQCVDTYMDKVDSIQSVGEIPAHVDVINLKPVDLERIKKYESEALVGAQNQIVDYIKETDLEFFETFKDEIIERACQTPAWGVRTMRGAKIILNTELVRDADVRKIFLRHEAVEVSTQYLALDSLDVATQIGIDPQIVIFDPYNGPQHYVALYHQVVMAHELEKSKEMLSELKRNVGQIVGREILPMFKGKEIEDGKT